VIKKLGQDKTVLFSSHILQEVQAICDRVIIINKGVIVADDQLSNLQKGSSNEQYVLVQFKEDITAEMITELEDVLSSTRLETGSWKLKTNHPENVRKQLLELSLRHNLNIISLQNETDSLEHIFRSLTN
jgi:ABC-2 type transport system ATP-binding protein